MESLHASLVEANRLFIQAVDSLKSHVREVIDYYAVDLVDMACALINSWLVLQDAPSSEHKHELARGYILAQLPQIHRLFETIQAAEPVLLQKVGAILAY